MEILGTKKYGWVFFFMTLICFFLYGSSLHNGFLLDDNTEILQKSILHDFKHLGYVLRNIDLPSGESIELHHRPVSSLVRMILYHFFKGNAFYYHLFNIVLFVLDCFLLFLLVILLTKDDALAFFTALLYMVHPINSISVNFVAAHEVLLFGIFSQLTGIMFLLWAQQHILGKRVCYYGLSLICFVLSLLTQEITISLPIFIFMIAYLVKKFNFQDSARIALPYILVAIGYSLFKFSFSNRAAHVLLKHMTESQVGIREYLASMVQLLGWYFSKLVIPTDIVLMWNMKAGEHAGELTAMIGFLLAAVFFGVTLRYRCKDIKFFAFFWFLLGLVPISVLCFLYYDPLGFVIEPHWFFFTQGGFFLLLAIVLKDVKAHIPRWAWATVCILLLASWTQWTKSYNLVWKNEKSYAQYWSNVVPHNAYALRALGKAYAQDGEYEKALFYLNKALVYLDTAALYHDMGEVYIQLNQLDNAKKYLQKCLQIQPGYEHAYNSLGTIYFREKDLNKAQEMFRKAIAIDPFDITALLNLADVYIIVNKTSDAIQVLQKILEINRQHRERRNILVKLAVLYNQEKNFDKSFEMINTIVKENLAPDSFLALSVAFKTMGNRALALSVLDSCLRIYPYSKEAYLLYGVILVELQKYDEARHIWETGLRFIPGDEELKKNIRMLQELLSGVKD